VNHRADFVAALLEKLGEDVADRLFVVRDQDPAHGYSVCAFARGARFCPRTFPWQESVAAADNDDLMSGKSVAIIGAGPAGLTAAYLLCKEGVPVTVIEADPELVGGIARTASYKGYHFDIGGHRFFSKSKEVEDLWTELLPADMLDRPRSSRIYYNGRFFSYPLKAGEALRKLGIFESARCMLSYFKARLFPVKNPKHFEDWVSNQFGKRLFNIFFKTYTEKVWGMSCKEISADWAAQRIKGLSLWSAVKNALFKKKTPAGGDKSKV